MCSTDRHFPRVFALTSCVFLSWLCLPGRIPKRLKAVFFFRDSGRGSEADDFFNESGVDSHRRKLKYHIEDQVGKPVETICRASEKGWHFTGPYSTLDCLESGGICMHIAANEVCTPQCNGGVGGITCLPSGVFKETPVTCADPIVCWKPGLEYDHQGSPFQYNCEGHDEGSTCSVTSCPDGSEPLEDLTCKNNNNGRFSGYPVCVPKFCTEERAKTDGTSCGVKAHGEKCSIQCGHGFTAEDEPICDRGAWSNDKQPRCQENACTKETLPGQEIECSDYQGRESCDVRCASSDKVARVLCIQGQWRGTGCPPQSHRRHRRRATDATDVTLMTFQLSLSEGVSRLYEADPENMAGKVGPLHFLHKASRMKDPEAKLINVRNAAVSMLIQSGSAHDFISWSLFAGIEFEVIANGAVAAYVSTVEKDVDTSILFTALSAMSPRVSLPFLQKINYFKTYNQEPRKHRLEKADISARLLKAMGGNAQFELDWYNVKYSWKSVFEGAMRSSHTPRDAEVVASLTVARLLCDHIDGPDVVSSLEALIEEAVNKMTEIAEMDVIWAEESAQWSAFGASVQPRGLTGKKCLAAALYASMLEAGASRSVAAKVATAKLFSLPCASEDYEKLGCFTDALGTVSHLLWAQSGLPSEVVEAEIGAAKSVGFDDVIVVSIAASAWGADTVAGLLATDRKDDWRSQNALVLAVDWGRAYGMTRGNEPQILGALRKDLDTKCPSDFFQKRSVRIATKVVQDLPVRVSPADAGVAASTVARRTSGITTAKDDEPQGCAQQNDCEISRWCEGDFEQWCKDRYNHDGSCPETHCKLKFPPAAQDLSGGLAARAIAQMLGLGYDFDFFENEVLDLLQNILTPEESAIVAMLHGVRFNSDPVIASTASLKYDSRQKNIADGELAWSALDNEKGFYSFGDVSVNDVGNDSPEVRRDLAAWMTTAAWKSIENQPWKHVLHTAFVVAESAAQKQNIADSRVLLDILQVLIHKAVVWNFPLEYVAAAVSRADIRKEFASTTARAAVVAAWVCTEFRIRGGSQLQKDIARAASAAANPLMREDSDGFSSIDFLTKGQKLVSETWLIKKASKEFEAGLATRRSFDQLDMERQVVAAYLSEIRSHTWQTALLTAMPYIEYRADMQSWIQKCLHIAAKIAIFWPSEGLGPVQKVRIAANAVIDEHIKKQTEYMHLPVKDINALTPFIRKTVAKLTLPAMLMEEFGIVERMTADLTRYLPSVSDYIKLNSIIGPDSDVSISADLEIKKATTNHDRIVNQEQAVGTEVLAELQLRKGEIHSAVSKGVKTGLRWGMTRKAACISAGRASLAMAPITGNNAREILNAVSKYVFKQFRDLGEETEVREVMLAIARAYIIGEDTTVHHARVARAGVEKKFATLVDETSFADLPTWLRLKGSQAADLSELPTDSPLWEGANWLQSYWSGNLAGTPICGPDELSIELQLVHGWSVKELSEAGLGCEGKLEKYKVPQFGLTGVVAETQDWLVEPSFDLFDWAQQHLNFLQRAISSGVLSNSDSQEVFIERVYSSSGGGVPYHARRLDTHDSSVRINAMVLGAKIDHPEHTDGSYKVGADSVVVQALIEDLEKNSDTVPVQLKSAMFQYVSRRFEQQDFISNYVSSDPHDTTTLRPTTPDATTRKPTTPTIPATTPDATTGKPDPNPTTTTVHDDGGGGGAGSLPIIAGGASAGVVAITSLCCCYCFYWRRRGTPGSHGRKKVNVKINNADGTANVATTNATYICQKANHLVRKGSIVWKFDQSKVEEMFREGCIEYDIEDKRPPLHPSGVCLSHAGNWECSAKVKTSSQRGLEFIFGEVGLFPTSIETMSAFDVKTLMIDHGELVLDMGNGVCLRGGRINDGEEHCICVRFDDDTSTISLLVDSASRFSTVLPRKPRLEGGRFLIGHTIGTSNDEFAPKHSSIPEHLNTTFLGNLEVRFNERLVETTAAVDESTPHDIVKLEVEEPPTENADSNGTQPPMENADSNGFVDEDRMHPLLFGAMTLDTPHPGSVHLENLALENPASFGNPASDRGSSPNSNFSRGWIYTQVPVGIPAFMLHEPVEYYSERNGTWIQAYINGYARSGSRADPETKYSVRLSNGHQRIPVDLSALRPIFRPRQPCSVYAVNRKEWFPAVCAVNQPKDPTRFGYNVHMLIDVSSFFFGGLPAPKKAPASIIRHRLLPGTMVWVYQGNEKGWVEAEVVGSEELDNMSHSPGGSSHGDFSEDGGALGKVLSTKCGSKPIAVADDEQTMAQERLSSVLHNPSAYIAVGARRFGCEYDAASSASSFNQRSRQLELCRWNRISVQVKQGGDAIQVDSYKCRSCAAHFGTELPFSEKTSPRGEWWTAAKKPSWHMISRQFKLQRGKLGKAQSSKPSTSIGIRTCRLDEAFRNNRGDVGANSPEKDMNQIFSV